MGDGSAAGGGILWYTRSAVPCLWCGPVVVDQGESPAYPYPLLGGRKTIKGGVGVPVGTSGLTHFGCDLGHASGAVGRVGGGSTMVGERRFVVYLCGTSVSLSPVAACFQV